MARHFDNNVADYLLYTGAAIPVSPTTYTISAWCRRASTQSDNNNIYSQVSAFNVDWLGLAIDGSNLAMFFSKAGGTAAANATSSAATVLNQWHHICGVQSGLTLRTVYLDAGNTGTSTTSQNPAAGKFTAIGTFKGDADPTTGPFDGDIAEVAVWSAALDAAEVQALARGLSPAQIRPASLLAYWPLLSHASPEIDVWRSQAMTVNGTVAQADHPPVLYPRRRSLGIDAPGGGGGGGSGSVVNKTISIPIGLGF